MEIKPIAYETNKNNQMMSFIDLIMFSACVIQVTQMPVENRIETNNKIVLGNRSINQMQVERNAH